MHGVRADRTNGASALGGERLRSVSVGYRPLLPKALELIEAWGFKYKTVGFYWAKTNKRANLDCLTRDDFFTGLGYWSRANVEQCLLATRGSPPRMAKDVKRLVIGPRREHSRKPDEVYSRIERLAQGPYLEMFSRQSRAGWDALGNQAALFDTGAVRTRNRPSHMGRWLTHQLSPQGRQAGA